MTVPKGYRQDSQTLLEIINGKTKYSTLYKWVRRNYPRPIICENCVQVPPRVLANITGVYNKNFDNWSWLCLDCNRGYKNI